MSGYLMLFGALFHFFGGGRGLQHRKDRLQHFLGDSREVDLWGGGFTDFAEPRSMLRRSAQRPPFLNSLTFQISSNLPDRILYLGGGIPKSDLLLLALDAKSRIQQSFLPVDPTYLDYLGLYILFFSDANANISSLTSRLTARMVLSQILLKLAGTTPGFQVLHQKGGSKLVGLYKQKLLSIQQRRSILQSVKLCD